MGILQGLRKSKPVAALLAATASKEPTRLSRDRLRHVAGEQAKAAAALSDLEARIERLTMIIADGAAAKAVLAVAIDSDGGIALAEYAAGRASESEIAGLVAIEATATKAAAAAVPALQKTQGQLEAARSEVIRLDLERQSAVREFLRMCAENNARNYTRACRQMFQEHDRLLGISAALSVAGPDGQIAMSLAPIIVPNFNLKGSADPNEYLATARHIPIEHDVRQAHHEWLRAFSVLVDDADADVDDLVGVTG